MKAFKMFQVPSYTAAALQQVAEAAMSTEPAAFQQSNLGFTSLPSGNLVETIHGVGHQMRVRKIERLLPAKVVKRETEIAIKQWEDQAGHPAGRRTKQELKEQTIDRLLPKAFMSASDIDLLFTPDTMFIGSSSDTKVDAIIGLLILAFNLSGAPEEFVAQRPTRRTHFGDPDETQDANNIVPIYQSDLFYNWVLGYADLPEGYVVGTAFRSEGSQSSVLSGKHEKLSDFFPSERRIVELELQDDDVSFRLTEDLTFKSIKWSIKGEDDETTNIIRANKLVALKEAFL